MGTRSSTNIIDNSGSEPVTLARLYIQYDGYPSGVGNDIKRILGGKTVVNGFNDADTQINGPGCMAAMLIAGLKQGCGGVYLTNPATEDREGYHYEVECNGPGDAIILRIFGYDEETLYDGPLNDFNADEVSE